MLIAWQTVNAGARGEFQGQSRKAGVGVLVGCLEMLEELSGVSYEVAAAIVDWRDTDSEPNADGAESDTYLRLHGERLSLITEDDDSGNGYNAQIRRRLDAGTYFVEATPLWGGANTPYDIVVRTE